ncbi:MAG TPA: putative 2-dehydropantoate 2-reductase [Verrucomicrobiae bacterium]|nr:putative 2-dehydropantoate 2-reductase [Verrucomicrobiae bacterium]
MRRSYAIIGTGALGGFYGARLQHAGCDVHFLLHSDYEHVRQQGLICESKDGDFTLPRVNAYRDARDMPKCAVVCLCLKTTQNHLLPQLLPPVVKDDGAVLVMQNGLGIEEQVADIVGAKRVMGGLCFLCSNKIGPGHIRHLDYGHVGLGEFATRAITDRLRAVAEDLNRAGIATELHDDLRVARWQKLVWNIPYNGLSVVLNATTDELMKNPHTRRLVERLMWEVVVDAHACGVTLPEGIVTKMLSYTDNMIPYRTSMKIDYDEHHPMEVEAIFGNPLRAAQQAGVRSPLLDELFCQLKFLDARNAAPAR